MYKVYTKTNKLRVQAKAMKVENGNLFFFFDEEALKIKQIIPHGKWDSWEALDEKHCISILNGKEMVEPKEKVEDYPKED